MAVKAIAHSYWRRIKNNTRSFDSVPKSVKDDVRTLAQADVKNGVISADDYKKYIGEDYPTYNLSV